MKTPSKALMALFSLAALTVPQSAAMAATSSFSEWYDEFVVVANNHATYSIDLGTSGISAEVDIQWDNTDLNNRVTLDTTLEEETWLNAKTPFGKMVGSNFSDTDDRYFSVRGTTTSTITIDFNQTIPAKHLVWAISDIDVEEVVVSGSSVADGTLTGTQLVSFASPIEFNFCDVTTDIPDVCDGETSVPRVSVNASDVTALPAESSDDEGDTMWGIVDGAIDQLIIDPEIEGLWASLLVNCSDEPS
jgi:hypothetical protein